MKSLLPFLFIIFLATLNSKAQKLNNEKRVDKIFCSKTFTITVENDKGVGVYCFNKPDKIWRMEYWYKSKNKNKPFKLVDKSKLEGDKFKFLEKVMVYRSNNYPDGDASYKITNETDSFKLDTPYFSIWEVLRGKGEFKRASFKGTTRTYFEGDFDKSRRNY